MNKSGYEFRVRDRSLLLPLYARYLWDPLTGRLPAWITPNQITLVANLCAAVGYGLLLGAVLDSPLTMALVAATNFVYFTLDNLDGRQARRTRRCSSLGEYLDHWFDAWNIGFLVLAIGIYFDVADWIFLFAMLSCSLGFFMTYWEQYRTGCVELSPIGPNEGLTAVSLLMVWGALAGKHALATPLWGAWSVAGIFAGLMALGFLSVVGSTAWRNRRALWDLLGLASGHSLAVLWYCTGTLPLIAAGTLMVLVHAGHTGRVLSCRLQGQEYRKWDPLLTYPLAVGCIAATWSGSPIMSQGIAAAAAVVMGLGIACDATTTILRLRMPRHATLSCETS